MSLKTKRRKHRLKMMYKDSRFNLFLSVLVNKKESQSRDQCSVGQGPVAMSCDVAMWELLRSGFGTMLKGGYGEDHEIQWKKNSRIAWCEIKRLYTHKVRKKPTGFQVLQRQNGKWNVQILMYLGGRITGQ